MYHSTTKRDVDEFVRFTNEYAAQLLAQGPEACKEFLDRIALAEEKVQDGIVLYPCDMCASDGRCMKHRSCKEYKEWLVCHL
jgi:hypothetical protein